MLWLYFVAAGLVSVWGEGASESEGRNPEAAVTMVGPGVFRIGSVMLNREERTVSFPAVVNTNAGPMEYLLVHGRGKVHESILETDAEPYHVHVAMLLLGASAPTNGMAESAEIPPGGRRVGDPAFRGTNEVAESKGGPPRTVGGLQEGAGPIENPGLEKLEGAKISVLVKWVSGGKSNSVAGEKLVWNTETKGSPEKLEWVYNGSRLVEGRFIAQIEGSMVSLITDAGAMVNHLSPGRENDQIWTANTNELPPAKALLEVVFRLGAK